LNFSSTLWRLRAECCIPLDVIFCCLPLTAMYVLLHNAVIESPDHSSWKYNKIIKEITTFFSFLCQVKYITFRCGDFIIGQNSISTISTQHFIKWRIFSVITFSSVHIFVVVTFSSVRPPPHQKKVITFSSVHIFVVVTLSSVRPKKMHRGICYDEKCVQNFTLKRFGVFESMKACSSQQVRHRYAWGCLYGPQYDFSCVLNSSCRWGFTASLRCTWVRAK